MLEKTSTLNSGDLLKATLDRGAVINIQVKKNKNVYNGLELRESKSKTVLAVIHDLPWTLDNIISEHPDWDEIISNGSLRWA